MTKKILIYDFDGTLTPQPFASYELFDEAGVDQAALTKTVTEIMEAKKISVFDAFYEACLKILSEQGYPLNDTTFCTGSKNVSFCPGVEQFFKQNENEASHYIVSSGIEIFLKHLVISDYFEEIFGATFKYEDGLAIGIDRSMNDKKKVDMIKLILKRHNITDDNCKDVVYLGDGITDFYAMQFVKDNGGDAVCVYHSKDNIEALTKLEEHNVVTHNFIADYSSTSELYNYLVSKMNNA